ncbi:MAG: histidine phosphatase family protein [Patescibacteria group bacterium]|jgi:broad specificity phosphatase PhoE
MKNYCTIYLTRHGETEWNVKRIVQGQSDIPLNKNGELQAQQLGEQFKSMSFEAVFSSDLIRAKRSAEIIVLEKKLAVITTKALRERLFGRFEGKHIDELRKVLGELMTISKEKQKELLLQDVENDEDVVARLIPFVREVAVAYPGKNILMVTHGGLMRAFLSHIDFKIPEYSDSPMKNAGYLIIESDGVEIKIKEERLF